MKDQELLIAEYRMVSTANVSDGLDRLQLNGTPHGIGPLWDACGKIVGPACTLKLVSLDEAENHPSWGHCERLSRVERGIFWSLIMAEGWTLTLMVGLPDLQRVITV